MANNVDNIPSRWKWSFGKSYKNIMTVDNLATMYATEILTWLQSMFEYDGLPDTIPQRELELILQQLGYVAIAKVDDNVYAFNCGLGGPPDVYYLPTKATISNPALKYTGILEIDKECVVIRNDSFYRGLTTMINETAYLLAQCDISFKFASINTRVPTIITAPNQRAYEEATQFIKKIEEGKELSVIGDSPVLKGITAFDYAKDSGSITHLIELKQYIWGTFLQRIGIQAQFNMKREALNQAETTMNDDILYPLIEDMLKERQIGLDKVNKMFGLNISVRKGGIWKDLDIEKDLAIDKIAQEVEILSNEANLSSSDEEENLEGKEVNSENVDN